jgi:gamma-glutamyl hydrolase
MKLSIIRSAAGAALESHQFLTSMQQNGSIDTNEQPVIGILSQPLDSDFDGDSRFDGYDSYLMAAYVKFVEAAGARVVPLIWGEPVEVTMDKLSKLNGVLFPGGANDYNDFGRMIIGKLIEYNDKGLIYPAYGICHGF